MEKFPKRCLFVKPELIVWTIQVGAWEHGHQLITEFIFGPMFLIRSPCSTSPGAGPDLLPHSSRSLPTACITPVAGSYPFMTLKQAQPHNLRPERRVIYCRGHFLDVKPSKRTTSSSRALGDELSVSDVTLAVVEHAEAHKTAAEPPAAPRSCRRHQGGRSFPPATAVRTEGLLLSQK